jgi:hypothetical protein
VGSSRRRAPVSSLGVEPFRAHHGQKHITLGDAFIDCLTEVASRFDADHIHEHRMVAEVIDEIVKDTARLALRITSSIADKNGVQFAFPSGELEITGLLAPELADPEQQLDKVYSSNRRKGHRLPGT